MAVKTLMGLTDKIFKGLNMTPLDVFCKKTVGVYFLKFPNVSPIF
jgi:hypothetical protein